MMLFVVSVGTARPAAAQSCALHSQCGPGALCTDTGCQDLRAALDTGTNTLYWVDAQSGSDQHPGTEAQPFRTIARATSAGLAPGDAVVLREGTYHEAIHPETGGAPDAPITFVAYPGEQVVVSGAEPLELDWSPDGGGVYVSTWPYEVLFAPHLFNNDFLGGPQPSAKREMIIANGQVLTTVYSRSALEPGSMFIAGDPTAPQGEPVYVWLPGGADPNAAQIETSRTNALFNPDPGRLCHAPTNGRGHYRIIGITFRHTANRQQMGAVCAGADGSVVEGVTAEQTNGTGLAIGGRDHVLRDVRALENGLSGIRVTRCTDCLVDRAEAAYNGWKNAPSGYEGGAGKVNRTRHSTFRRLYYHDNRGRGLWLDYRNYHNRIERSRFGGNRGSNLFLELHSGQNAVVNNVFYGGGPASWYNARENGTGVTVAASDSNLIAHNTFANLWGSCYRIKKDHRAPSTANGFFNNICAGPTQNPDPYSAIYQRDQRAGASASENQANPAGGNAYWPDAPARGAIFFYAPYGESALATNDLGAFADAVGAEGGSFMSDPEQPHLRDWTDPAGGGWQLAASSQYEGQAVALPPAFDPWTDALATDFFGADRPAASPALGAMSADGGTPDGETQQTLTLHPGWNLASLAVEPINNTFESLLSAIVQHVVLVKDEEGNIYSPSDDINTIGSWAVGDAYMIYTDTTTSWTVSGSAVDSSTELALDTGWNLVAYLPSAAMPIEEALTSIEADLVIVKDEVGEVYAPLYGINTIGDMQPGEGYKIYITAPTTLTYPSAQTAAPGAGPSQ